MVNDVSSPSQASAWLKLGMYRLSVVLNTYPGSVYSKIFVVTAYTKLVMVNFVSSPSQASA